MLYGVAFAFAWFYTFKALSKRYEAKHGKKLKGLSLMGLAYHLISIFVGAFAGTVVQIILILINKPL